MHPLDYFQRIYIINLPDRVDRRREMSEQLAAIGLSLEGGNVELFPARRPESTGGFPSIGARGCFLSHLDILRAAVEKGYSRILILEDDLNFSPEFVSRFEALAPSLDREGWNHFYGGYTMAEPPIPEGNSGLAYVPPATPVQCTHFVGFNGATIANLVSYLEAILSRPSGDPHGGPMHVDGAYTWYRRANKSERTFVASPELGYQRSSRTDVHQLRWYDKLPLIQKVSAMVRQYKNSWK